MSSESRTVSGYQVRDEHGNVSDDEIHRYLRCTGANRVRDIQDFFELPRTTVWTALRRLRRRELVERAVSGHRGVASVWRALRPEWDQLTGEQYADRRTSLGVSQADAHRELSRRVEDAVSQSKLSKFENGRQDLDTEHRRALYQYYEEVRDE